MPILACVIAIIISAGTLALSVHLITAPEIGAQHAAAPANVRPIPLGKTPDVSRGDPHNQLTPIYPASPGQDLPDKDLPPPSDVAGGETVNDTPADKPVAEIAPAAETTGVAANADDRDAAAPSPSPAVMPDAATTAAAPNSCAIAACSAAYRSFRESDCTYQPFDGPRRTCELGDSGMQNATAVSVPPQGRDRSGESRNRMRRQVDEFDDVGRVVRSLPARDYDEGDRIVIIEEPRMGYGRPRVIYRED